MKISTPFYSLLVAIFGHLVLLIWLSAQGNNKPVAQIQPPTITHVSFLNAAPVIAQAAAPIAAPEPKPQPTPPKPKAEKKPKIDKKPVDKPKPKPRENAPKIVKKTEPIEEDNASSDDSAENAAPVTNAKHTQKGGTGSGEGEAKTPSGPVVPPSFSAAYLSNPQPAYPSASRQMGEEGNVHLMVSVDANGRVSSLYVHKSSGYNRLDQAAMNAVRHWRFVPAKQGNTNIAGQVIVPIRFKLEFGN